MSQFPPLSSRISVEQGDNITPTRSLRRPLDLQPLHSTSPFRSKKVASSTCPRPQVSNDQAIGGLADEMSITSTDYHLSGAEYHVAEMLGQGSITADEAYQALSDLNS